jgi:hypothetical protein
MTHGLAPQDKNGRTAISKRHADSPIAPESGRIETRIATFIPASEWSRFVDVISARMNNGSA